MKQIGILAAVIAGIVMAVAAVGPAYAATENGYLRGTGDSASFMVTNPGGKVEITFSYPKGSVDFWVSTLDQAGAVSRYDLDNWKSITLMGAGLFTVTVYSRNGAGNWSADYTLPTYPPAVPSIGGPPSAPSTPLSSAPSPDFG